MIGRGALGAAILRKEAKGGFYFVQSMASWDCLKKGESDV
jgi:hypothetical protein